MDSATLDDGIAYRLDGQPGIAFRVLGPALVWEPATTLAVGPNGEEEEVEMPGEGDWTDDPDRVRVVMLGDDREQVVDVADLTPLAEGDYCNGCGQIGCG